MKGEDFSRKLWQLVVDVIDYTNNRADHLAATASTRTLPKPISARARKRLIFQHPCSSIFGLLRKSCFWKAARKRSIAVPGLNASQRRVRAVRRAARSGESKL
jgi:hypothetical protein